MPNFEFTSPIYVFFLVLYFITSSIKTFDIRINQCRAGMMGKEMQEEIFLEPPIPSWVTLIYWVDWLIAIILFILNWKITLIVFLSRFLLKVIPVLETVGNIILRPFRPKFPPNVSELHLIAARDLMVLHKTSTEDKDVFTYRIERVRESFENLSCNNSDVKAIKEALDYLNADDSVKQDVEYFCEQQKESLEWKSNK